MWASGNIVVTGQAAVQAQPARCGDSYAQADTHENHAEWTAMLFAMGSLWQNGITIDWEAFYVHEDRRRIPLPTYRFERQRFWVDPAIEVPGVAQRVEAPPVCATASVAVPTLESRSPVDRKERFVDRIVEAILPLSGRDRSQISTVATFLEQGFDSLSLTQVAAVVHKEFGVKVTFGQLMNLLPSIDMLASHLDKAAPVEDSVAAPLSERLAEISPVVPVVSEVGIPQEHSSLQAVVAEQAHTIARLVSYLDKVGTTSTVEDRAETVPVEIATTTGQREIWFASQLSDSASLSYNLLVPVHLRGKLDLEALRAALQALVSRHDALRLTLSEDGQRQFVNATKPLYMPLIDLSVMTETQRISQLGALAGQQLQTVFNLVDGPLMKAQLVRLSSEEHVLQLMFHHVLIDGWSTHVLVMDLCQLYSANVRGVEAELSPAMRYRDYVAWYYEADTVRARQIESQYWMNAFADLPASIELPSKGLRGAPRSYRAGTAYASIDLELYEHFKRSSAKFNSTLFHFLLATFSLWLRRVSGQSDVIVGVPVAGQLAVNLQHIAGCERMVGHSSNLIPIRSHVNDSVQFLDYLGDIKGKLLEGRANEGFDFGDLVQKLNPHRDPSRAPFISVTLNLNDEPPLDAGGLQVDVGVPPRSHMFFDLEVNVWESPKGLRVACYYADDLFEAETVNGWLLQWKTLMASAADSPAKELYRLDWVSLEDQGLLVDWNSTAADFSRQMCVHRAFELQCVQRPNPTALWADDETLSYVELDSKANRFAHVLRTRGVQRGHLVGLCVERGAEMLAAVLGILKAGAAYVPLDPSFPQDRLRYMAQDAGLALLVCSEVSAGLFDLSREQQLRIDTDAARIEAAPANALNPDDLLDARPEDPAYVIYTSGSTGKPKGVMVQHRAVVKLFEQHGTRARAFI